MMEFLKWTGYTIVSFMGLCLVIGVAALLVAIGATLGTIVLGGFLVFLGAMGIREYFETPTAKR